MEAAEGERMQADVKPPKRATRDDYVSRIVAARIRQFNMPGTERDVRNTPNDWVAIAAHYLFDEVRRNAVQPDREAFEESLIKAAAVILAALEHTDMMQMNGQFSA